MAEVTRKGFRDKNGKQVVIVPNVPNATPGNLASFDAEGNLQDSGKKPADFAQAGHSHSAIMDASTESSVSIDEGVISIVLEGEGSGGETEIDVNNIGNLHRALQNPDTEPTEDSNKLITSGGVKAALDEVANNINALEYKDGSYESRMGVGQLNRDDDELDGASIYGKDAIRLGVNGNRVFIDVNNINNLKRALATPSSVPENDDTKLITSKAVYNFTPRAISNAGHGISVDEDGEISIGSAYVVISVEDGVDGGEAEINTNNIDNLNRALATPSSIPENDATKLITSKAVFDALDGKANYYAGQLTIRNEGQSGFPVDGVQAVEEELDAFIASTTAAAKYHSKVNVYKGSTVAEFPCLISWTESNNDKTVTILVSHYTFTALRDDEHGGQWDQAFTVANNSSFFEVL